MTTTVLDTKIGEIENKIPDYAKYVPTPEFNKSSDLKLDKKLKQANLATNSDVNVASQLANKNEEKTENYKRLSYFLGKIFFGEDGFQDMFIYQPTYSMKDFFEQEKNFQNMFIYQPPYSMKNFFKKEKNE